MTFLWLSCKTRGGGRVEHYELCWGGEAGLEQLVSYELGLAQTGLDVGTFLGFTKLSDAYWESGQAFPDFRAFLDAYI